MKSVHIAFNYQGQILEVFENMLDCISFCSKLDGRHWATYAVRDHE